MSNHQVITSCGRRDLISWNCSFQMSNPWRGGGIPVQKQCWTASRTILSVLHAAKRCWREKFQCFKFISLIYGRTLAKIDVEITQLRLPWKWEYTNLKNMAEPLLQSDIIKAIASTTPRTSCNHSNAD